MFRHDFLEKYDPIFDTFIDSQLEAEEPTFEIEDAEKKKKCPVGGTTATVSSLIQDIVRHVSSDRGSGWEWAVHPGALRVTKRGGIVLMLRSDADVSPIELLGQHICRSLKKENECHMLNFFEEKTACIPLTTPHFGVLANLGGVFDWIQSNSPFMSGDGVYHCPEVVIVQGLWPRVDRRTVLGRVRLSAFANDFFPAYRIGDVPYRYPTFNSIMRLRGKIERGFVYKGCPCKSRVTRCKYNFRAVFHLLSPPYLNRLDSNGEVPSRNGQQINAAQEAEFDSEPECDTGGASHAQSQNEGC